MPGTAETTTAELIEISQALQLEDIHPGLRVAVHHPSSIPTSYALILGEPFRMGDFWYVEACDGTKYSAEDALAGRIPKGDRMSWSLSHMGIPPNNISLAAPR